MSNSQIKQLDKIERMLTAVLRSQNNLHVIGGYVYGETSLGHPFVILYPASDKLNHKVCRVYPDQFKRLPDFIPTQNIKGDTDANPDKDKAMKRGIYHECPLFQVATYDGKETQMGNEKRFSGVLWVSGKQVSDQAPPAPPQAQPARRGGVNKAKRVTMTAADEARWLNEVDTAENALMFDTAVAKMLSFYPDAESVGSFRGVLFGERFEAELASAYFDGLDAYAAERERANGGRDAHEGAKIEGLRAFNIAANR